MSKYMQIVFQVAVRKKFDFAWWGSRNRNRNRNRVEGEEDIWACCTLQVAPDMWLERSLLVKIQEKEKPIAGGHAGTVCQRGASDLIISFCLCMQSKLRLL